MAVQTRSKSRLLPTYLTATVISERKRACAILGRFTAEHGPFDGLAVSGCGRGISLYNGEEAPAISRQPQVCRAMVAG
jgi:hypothetical protein